MKVDDLSWIEQFANELDNQVRIDKQVRMDAIYQNIVNPKRDHARDKERNRLLGLD